MKSIDSVTHGEFAAYYPWGDRQALAQAVLVSKSVTIDLSNIEDWSNWEG